jgi:UDP-glucose 4-epimerase
MKASYNRCNVLVTGGAGFIGSHLVEALIHLGAYVTVLDNFKTGRRENITGIKESIALIEGDITDFQTCKEATSHQELIFHCAAETSVPESMQTPFLTHQVNVNGTANLLEAARINGVKRFIFSSSSAVYGQQLGLCAETAQCKPASPYGFSKLIGEMMCKQYTQNFGLETVSLRYFNVYGPRQDPFAPYAAVIAHFRAAMAANKPITVYGDGLQTRDFVPVKQVVETNLKVGILASTFVSGLALNCATGTSITVLQLIQKLKHEFPHFSEGIYFAPARPGDVKHTAADCTRYKKVMEDYQKYSEALPAFIPEEPSQQPQIT